MKIIAKKTNILNGAVLIPASKSHTVRGLVFGLLAPGTSLLENPLHSQDSRDAIEACRAYGAKIAALKNRIKIKSKGIPFSDVRKNIKSGNSGITTRFLLPLLGLRKEDLTAVSFTCGDQMKKRPIIPLVNALNSLGMDISWPKSGWPLKVKGSLRGGRANITGLTSQYLSALLIGLPCAEKDSVIKVRDLNERPYVEMTEWWLKKQGIKYSHVRKGNSDTYKIKGGQRYKSFKMGIPGDFSSASYFIAAATLFPGKVYIRGLDMKDSQGDKELINILRKMGADIRENKKGLSVYGGKKLKGIKIDANATPDLVPALAVIGTQASGKTEILNVPQARIKETDRLHSMAEGLTSLGARIIEKEDGLIVYESNLKGGVVHGYDDHRTVMSLCLAGMLADGETEVDTAESINKTFPEYVRLMKVLGGQLKVKK